MADKNGPIVKRDFGNIVRNARGYSLQELTEAGIDSRLARVSGIPFDRLRKSKHEENVELLRKIAPRLEESRSQKKQQKKKPEKAKEEKKVERKKKKQDK